MQLLQFGRRDLGAMEEGKKAQKGPNVSSIKSYAFDKVSYRVSSVEPVE
jgi:hypothetical protein